MRSANPGCGLPPEEGLAAGALIPAPSHKAVLAGDRFGAQKYSNSSQQEVPLANYQGGGEFARANHSLAVSTTAVRGGGIVRAILPRGRPLEQLDTMTRSDSNIPCGQERVARWIYVDANPYADEGEQHIYGWYLYPSADGVREC